MALIRRRRKKPDPALEAEGIRDVVRKTDANPQLVATARFLRRLIPGGEPETSEMPEPMRRLVEEVQPQGPSTLREIGKGALQAWQALSEAQRRRQGTADVAIVFTDLVGFSDWALAAGDEAALEVLRQVGDAEQKAISSNKGAVVKRLGDGAMAVFGDAEQAVSAALEAQDGISEDRGGGVLAEAAGGGPPGHAPQGEGGLPRGGRQHRGPGRGRRRGRRGPRLRGRSGGARRPALQVRQSPRARSRRAPPATSRCAP